MQGSVFSGFFARLAIQGFCFFFLLGCLSQIELGTAPVGGRLVVSGQVSTISDQNFVELGRTAGNSRLPYPVEGAMVWLLDSHGNEYQWSEDSGRPGWFTLPGLNAVPGETYYIRVILPEGQTYLSQGEKVPMSNASGEVYYTIEEKSYIDLEGIVTTQPFVNVYTDAEFPATEEPLFVRWTVQESYVLRPTDFPDPFGMVPPPCYVVQAADPQRINLASSRALSGTSIGTLLLSTRLVDRSFHDRHFFTTYRTSLTEQAFDYWEKINIVANQVGSIFDTPPAEVKGNLYNGDNPDETVLGYFQATNQSYERFYLLPGDIPFTISFQSCEYSPSKSNNDYPNECLNCLTLRNSSYIRPPWF